MAIRSALAVIGAGYGDEGKGLMVDALASAMAGPTVVVRSNGGAQAGHTVSLADGRRHVFHHVTAGALAGAATHLSRFFVQHPMLFAPERDALLALGARVDVTVDPRSPVTTPWDMLINQATERSRGRARHGSCGLGFGETIERCLDPRFRLVAGDLARPGLRRRCALIRDAWSAERLAALGVVLTPEEAGVLADDRILEGYLEDCARFADLTSLRSDATIASQGRVIFEGAQGLMLDQAIGVMPHVTRSHTGLANMAAIAAEAGVDAIEAIYVTRAYATRHGAGPLPGGADALEAFDIVDPTNAPNAWQGRMRYAPLDVDRLAGAIAADLALVRSSALRIGRSLAVTCLDQARGKAPVLIGGELVYLAPEAVAPELGRRLDLPLHAESWGATRGQLRRSSALCMAA
jgi:adenylosuccinate synthase